MNSIVIIDIIIVIAIILFTLEILVAFIYYPLKRGRNYYQLIAKEGEVMFEYDPDIGYLLKPNINHQKPTQPLPTAPRRIIFVDVRTNNEGFLFPETIATLQEKYKFIFCLGGSTTAGFESRHDKTYPAILDSFVRKKGYRCINAGVGGYRSIHELLYFRKKILTCKPWAIIVFSGYNDFEDFSYEQYQQYNQFKHCLSHSLPTSYLQKILNNSACFHLLKRFFFKLSGRIRTESISTSKRENLRKALENDVWKDEWKYNISKIIDLCQESNIRIYLLSHVTPVYKDASREAKMFAEKDLNMNGRFDVFVEYIKLINSVAEDLCKEKTIKFLDVRDDFERYSLGNDHQIDYKKRFSLFTDRMHFTENGNMLLANSIYARIKEEL